MAKTKSAPGRPSNEQRKDISRETILTRALELAKVIPLQNLSIAAVAREMEITPALIHYYLGNRDQLLSGVMNLFYQQALETWPRAGKSWKNNIKKVCDHLYERFVEYGGIAAYASSNSRFRVFQLVGKNEPDFGVLMLDKFTSTVRQAGLSGQRTGIYAHLLMELIINTAHATARHLFPKDHKTFLQQKTRNLDRADFPNIHYAMQAPLNLDGRVAFNEACSLYLKGIERELGS